MSAASPTTPTAGRSPRRTALLATGALLLTTLMWGSTFPLTKDLLDRVPTLDYLAVRFAIAAAVMLLVAPRAVARLSKEPATGPWCSGSSTRLPRSARWAV